MQNGIETSDFQCLKSTTPVSQMSVLPGMVTYST